MRFAVDIADLDRKQHNACFREVAHAMVIALRRLDHQVVPRHHAHDRLILFGANATDSLVPPKDSILYNAEVLGGDADARRLIAGLTSDRIVWDYSSRNVEHLWTIGATKAVHCPVGYIDTMSAISSKTDQDIDVLFYGWLNDRRRAILADLRASGLVVHSICGLYGDARDDLIARSKIVLNLHFYASSHFEIFRCSHLFANRKCVVTEDGGKDPVLEALAQKACHYVPKDRIVEACRQLCQSSRARAAVAEAGFEEFKKIDFVNSVQRSLRETSVCV